MTLLTSTCLTDRGSAKAQRDMAIAARREREREARREAILDAAARTVQARGVRDARMEEIAAAAEVSKGTLYLYYPSKDALLAGLAERNIRGALPHLEAVATNDATGLDRLLGMVDAFVAHMDSSPNMYRLMIEWMNQDDIDDSSEAFAAYRARVATVMQLMVQCMQDGTRDGSIRADVDPLHQTLQVWSSCLGVLLMRQNAKAMSKRIAVPVDFARLLPLHLDTLRLALEAG